VRYEAEPRNEHISPKTSSSFLLSIIFSIFGKIFINMNRKLQPLFFILFIYLSFSLYSQQPLEPEHNYDVEHIKIEVRLNLENQTLNGRVTTSIRSTVNRLDSFSVDAVGMKVKSVKEWVLYQTDNPELAERFENVKYKYNSNHITVIPSHSIAKNYPYKYQVEYSVTDPEKGLYFIYPDSLFPDKPYQVWTQGEDEDNRWWIPCYDFPNDKATTEAYITIDKKYITLSNGELVSTKENNDGTKTWHWVLNHPISSYLIMLAAGNFDITKDEYDNIPIYSYVPVGKKDEAVKSFSMTPDMVKFFSDYAGFAYPWGRYSQIVVKDFVYGGMENASATVLTEASIYDDRTPPDYTAIGLVAHELAHQWWGDVVTCRNWNEIWLNESFATYFEALYREHAYGKDEFDYEIYRNGQASIETDSIDRRPIYTDEGLAVYAYDKGAVVLNMLRYLMGEDNFREAMNIYITKNAYGCVTTHDLIQAVNDVYKNPLLDRIPKDFLWFFDEWVYKAGQPEYNVSYDYNKNTNQVFLTIQQVQRPDSLISIFETPVPVEVLTEKSKLEYFVVCDSVPKTYTFSLDAPLKSVIFNKGNKVLCKLYFSKPKEDWLAQLQSDDDIDRITALRGLKDYISDDDVRTTLLNILSTDKFWGTRYEAASMLANSGTANTVHALEERYKNEADSRVRRSILLALGEMKKNFPDCADTRGLTDFIISSIKNENSYYAIADGITALSSFTDKDKLFDLIEPFAGMSSTAEIIKRSVIAAIDSSSDPRGINILIDNAVKGWYPRQRTAAVRALANFTSDSRVIEALNALIFSHNRWIKSAALTLIEKAKLKSSIPYLEKLADRTKDDALRKRVEKVIKSVQENQ
jgi:aminopeptidase N